MKIVERLGFLIFGLGSGYITVLTNNIFKCEFPFNTKVAFFARNAPDLFVYGGILSTISGKGLFLIPGLMCEILMVGSTYFGGDWREWSKVDFKNIDIYKKE